MHLWRAVLGMSHQRETIVKTQNILERLTPEAWTFLRSASGPDFRLRGARWMVDGISVGGMGFLRMTFFRPPPEEKLPPEPSVDESRKLRAAGLVAVPSRPVGLVPVQYNLV